MKNRIVVLFVILVTLCCSYTVGYAREIDKGTIQISGNSNAGFGRYTEKVEGSKSEADYLDFELEAVYYFQKNVAIGLLGGYSYTDVEYDTSAQRGNDAGNLDSEYTVKRIGPVVRLSVPLNDVTNLSLGATAGYASEEVADSYEAEGFFYGANAGISLFPVQSVSVDIGLKYLHEDIEIDEDSFFDSLDIERDGLSGQIGLSVYF